MGNREPGIEVRAISASRFPISDFRPRLLHVYRRRTLRTLAGLRIPQTNRESVAAWVEAVGPKLQHQLACPLMLAVGRTQERRLDSAGGRPAQPQSPRGVSGGA